MPAKDFPVDSRSVHCIYETVSIVAMKDKHSHMIWFVLCFSYFLYSFHLFPIYRVDHLPHHSNDEQPNGNAHVI